MNKTIKTLLCAIFCTLTVGAFAASKKSIICVTYPEYDWVMNILGDKASDFDVTLLQNNGTDLHSYQPTVKDIAKISTCDMLVYVGGESDAWVERAIETAKNKNMVVVNMMEVLGDQVKEEVVVEGMQVEEHHHHDGDHDHDHDHSKEVSTFHDHDVKDRSLADWAGEWQSPYPFVLDGTLDEAFEEKAESGTMTAAEYKEYYKTGYKTDIAALTIKGNKITYTYENGKKVSAKYKYVGYYIQEWSGGTKAAMYRFTTTSKKAGIPRFIEINDHMIEPAKAEHFHLRMSNESFEAIEDPEKYWPTFFPAEMSGHDIAEHLGGHHHHDEEEVEYDEHVWLSVKKAIIITKALSAEIQKIDSVNASVYQANTASYVKQLSDLDAEYTKVVASSPKKTVLFGDRFPFRYLTDDYNLEYFAAFVGCSAESEASFATIVFLANKVDELGLNAILTIEKSDKKIAKTIISNCKSKNQAILEMDSLQSVTQNEIDSGRNYLSAMKNNLEVLKKALQ
ncbi:MAG: ZinT/AdcA family metal-binding protein [Treponema sp.]|nr:ZinT/AdcA family metal-binding protein [Treponema sp.]